VLVWEFVEDRFDVIAIVFLALFVVVVFLAFERSVEILLDYNAAIESVAHTLGHLLKGDLRGFVLAA
jgi:hypothetical protein